MHLVIYTQKRDRPLILELHFIVPVLLALLSILLLCPPIYLGFENRKLKAANIALEKVINLTSAKALEAEKLISRLEERLRHAEEHPTTQEVFFEALDRVFDSGPPDTTFPNLPVDDPGASAEAVYVIQLAAVKTRDAAIGEAEKYRSSIPLAVEIEEFELASSRWYRVIATGFQSAREAEINARRLKAAGIINEYLIQSIGVTSAGAASAEEETP
jgi:SPOR domain